MLGEQGFYPQEKMSQRGWGRGELTLPSEGEDIPHLHLLGSLYALSVQHSPKAGHWSAAPTYRSALLADGMTPSDAGGTSFCVCNKGVRS